MYFRGDVRWPRRRRRRRLLSALMHECGDGSGSIGEKMHVIMKFVISRFVLLFNGSSRSKHATHRGDCRCFGGAHDDCKY